MDLPRPRLSALLASAFLLLLAPQASAEDDVWGYVPEVSFDPDDYVEYRMQCQNVYCPGLAVRACTGVLTVGANTDILPGGGFYVELANHPDGAGVYGGYSSYCNGRGMLYVGPGETE